MVSITPDQLRHMVVNYTQTFLGLDLPDSLCNRLGGKERAGEDVIASPIVSTRTAARHSSPAPGTPTMRHWPAGTAFAWTAKRSTRRGTAAFELPSITLNNVLGTQTLTRTVRNAGAASSTFSASASMDGYTVNVELATWRSRPARASLLVRRSRARRPRQCGATACIRCAVRCKRLPDPPALVQSSKLGRQRVT